MKKSNRASVSPAVAPCKDLRFTQVASPDTNKSILFQENYTAPRESNPAAFFPPPAPTQSATSVPAGEKFQYFKSARGARILLVDDDEILREIVAEALILHGYQVVCAEDGEAGWDSLCKLEFDLMITDHNMPRLSGSDLLKRMQNRPSQPRTIMITGYLPFQFPALANTLPFCEVLAKPFSLEELLHRVDDSLRSMEA